MNSTTAFLLGLAALAAIQILFKLLWKLRRPRMRSEARPVTVDDWILSHRSSSVDFGLPWSPATGEVVSCKLQCRHENNLVFSDTEIGATASDALQKAVAQMELTVGTRWRQKRSLLDAVEVHKTP